MSIDPVAFLFLADGLRIADLGVVCETIFRVVLHTDPARAFHLRSGGVLLWTFSQRTTAVGHGLAIGRPSVRSTRTDDVALRKALAVAFATSVSAMPRAIETEGLPWTLLTRNVECTASSEMTQESAELVHAKLKREFPGYLGYFLVDRGDPLTLQLAVNGLIPFCYYRDRTLRWIVPFDYGSAESPETEWAKALPLSSIELTSEIPERLAPKALSPSGKESAQLLDGRARSGHAENVLESLRDRFDRCNDTSEFEVAFGEQEFGRPRAEVRKLRDYCLNDQHTKADGTPGDGRAKAFRFRKLLGITREDWRFLGEQLAAALEQQLVVNKPRATAYGVQYDVVVPVTGRNGLTKLVTCAWIIRPGEPPSLATAFIADDPDTEQEGAISHLAVAKSGDADFYTRLYEKAHEHGTKAAQEWVPTPMWVGSEAISEGACGYAWVRLADARSRLSRWLKKNGFGQRGYAGGCVVFARTSSQSLERAQKYCESFAQVLRLNGFECQVDWQYD